MTRVRVFIIEALRAVGAEVLELGDTGDIQVGVPPAYRDVFGGRESLRCVFTAGRLEEVYEAELVAPGTFILDTLIDLCRRQDSVTCFYLPAGDSPASPPGLGAGDAQMIVSSSKPVYDVEVAFTFRLSYISDENREEICRISVDAASGKAVVTQDPPPFSAFTDADPRFELSSGIPLRAAFSAARTLAAQQAAGLSANFQKMADDRLQSEMLSLDEYYGALEEESRPRQKTVRQARRRLAAQEEAVRTKYGLVLDILPLAADPSAVSAAADALERNTRAEAESVRVRGWKALAMTAAYYEGEKKRAALLRRADLCADAAMITHEFWGELRSGDESKARAVVDALAEKDISSPRSRFEGKYGPLEPDSAQPDAGAFLEAEKRLRVSELQGRYTLKVLVTPVAVALVHRPRYVYSIALRRGEAEARFEVAYDPETKTSPVSCPGCGEPTLDLRLCDSGHLACAACCDVCVSCGRRVCTRCAGRLVHCRQCNAPTCSDCARSCFVCGSVFCRKHAPLCGVCGKPHCAMDSRPCSFCGHGICVKCWPASLQCVACRDLFPAAACVPAIEEILRDRTTRRYRRWLVGEGPDYFVFVGKRLLGSDVYVVDNESLAVIRARG